MSISYLLNSWGPRGFNGTAFFTATSAPAAASTIFTFTSMNIGTPSTTRFVIVSVSALRDVGVTTNSVTIGGIAATNLTQHQNSFHTISFWGAVVPTGNTANIVVTNSIFSFCAIAVYSCPGVNSVVPTATAFTTTIISNALTNTIIAPSSGFIISTVLGGQFPTPLRTFTWSGTSSPVEDHDTPCHNNTREFSSASTEHTTAGSVTVVATASGSLPTPLLVSIAMS